MGWGNGPPTWSEMERVLSGRPGTSRRDAEHPGDGSDSPAWSRTRTEYEARVRRPEGPVVPYAELHAHSAFSFLDGASTPEELAEEAARLGLEALAVTDHDGLYGAVRFAEAARELGIRTVFGAELGLDDAHLLVLARGQEGYRRLSRQIADAHLAGGEKNNPRYDYDALTDAAGGHWQILTGCRRGHLRQALTTGGIPAAEAALLDLVDRFGADRVTVELTRHGYPDDHERNAALFELAARHGIPCIASTAAHFAHPHRRRLAMAVAAISDRQSLDDAVGRIPRPEAGTCGRGRR